MRRRAARRANFVSRIRTEVVLPFDAEMIAEWVALSLPKPVAIAPLFFDCIAS